MKGFMKHIVFSVLVCMLIFSGCSKGAEDEASNGVESEPAAKSSEEEAPELSEKSVPDVWKTLNGIFTREGSSQYNNGTLQMKYLSNDCVIFEFDLMQGSESEDSSNTLDLSFVMLVGDDGAGHYESDPESANPLTVDFRLSQDGKKVTVSHTGELSISPDGVYEFIDEGFVVSEYSSIAILEHLPTVLTSLNANNGAYEIRYSDELVDNWYYPVEATFNDTGAVLAKFRIAEDLSAVYRVDDDIEPILIFGSPHPGVDAK